MLSGYCRASGHRCRVNAMARTTGGGRALSIASGIGHTSTSRVIIVTLSSIITTITMPYASGKS